MLSSRGGATTLLCVVLAGGGWALSMPELFAGGMALAAVILLSLLWVWFPANKPTLVASASPNPAHAATTVTMASCIVAIFVGLFAMLTRTRVGLIVQAALTHPHMVAVAGLVPCAAAGTMISLRFRSPRARW